MLTQQVPSNRSSRNMANFSDYNPKHSKTEQSQAPPSREKHGFKFTFRPKKPKASLDMNTTPVHKLISTTPLQTQSLPQQTLKIDSGSGLIEQHPRSSLPIISSENLFKAVHPFQSQNQSSLTQQINPLRQAEQDKQQQRVEGVFIQLFEMLLQDNRPNYQQLTAVNSLQNIRSFLQLRELLSQYTIKYQNEESVSQIQAELANLVATQIAESAKSWKKHLNTDDFSEVFVAMMTNNLEDYVLDLISNEIEDNIEKALEAANLTDKAFLYGQVPKYYRIQAMYLRDKDLSILKKSSWLLEFGLITRIMNQHAIFQLGKQIYSRYISARSKIFPSQLLLLGLKSFQFCSAHSTMDQSDIDQIKEDDIINMIQSVPDHSEQSQVELWLLFLVLTDYRHQYNTSFMTVFTKILQRLKHPQHFLEVVSFLGAQTTEVKDIFKIYQQQNKVLKQDPKKIQLLKKHITDSDSQTKHNKITLKMREWQFFYELLQLHEKANFDQFFSKLIKNFTILQHSDMINFQKLLELTECILLDFKFACNYKGYKRNQYYQVLIYLLSISKPYPQLNYLIQGCKCFIQLKQGIFCLKDRSKLKNLHFLKQRLQKQLQVIRDTDANRQWRRENLSTFLENINKVVLKMLNTNAGQLYLKQLSSQMKQEREKLQKTNDLQVLVGFADSSFTILTQLLKGNKQILNKMALMMYFS